MEKKNVQSTLNAYTNRQDEIRKAKGNPNKNIHAKKKNSNYGGYMVDTLTQKAAEQERVVLPRALKIAFAADVIVLIIVLTLRLTVLKDNLAVSYITTLLLGLTCGWLFYIRKRYHKEKTGLYKIIQVILCGTAVVYCTLGIMGFLNLLGLLQI